MTRRLLAMALAFGAIAASCGSKTGLEGGIASTGGAGSGPLDASAADTSRPGFDASIDVADEPPPVECDGGDVVLDVLVAPTVMLLVDQSGSMAQPLSAGTTRWDSLRDSLIGPSGLVRRLQSGVRFGLALYTAESAAGSEGGPPIGPCPRLTSVSPALGNLGRIEDEYRAAEPIEDTPTGDAIDAVVDQLLSLPPSVRDPSIIVLATDGEPDRCEDLDPVGTVAEAAARSESVQAAARAFSLGFRTFVISLGEGSVPAQHLQDMANAGLGRGPADPPAEFFEAGDDRGLRSALQQIIDNEISCALLLDGRIIAQRACEGTLILNGRPIPCEGADGWRAIDSRQIELRGAACAELQAIPEPTVTTVFPCEVVTAGAEG